MVDVLVKLKDEGKDHLCVIPHGPLHYYPFHLLGEPGSPLANDWIVTYLPSYNPSNIIVSTKSKSKFSGLIEG